MPYGTYSGKSSGRYVVDILAEIAGPVIQLCDDTKSKLQGEKFNGGELENAKNFIEELSTYLKNRKLKASVFSNDEKYVRGVCNYIKTILKEVKENNKDGQLAKLAEKNIFQFKGFFSANFYNILCNRRDQLSGKIEKMNISLKEEEEELLPSNDDFSIFSKRGFNN